MDRETEERFRRIIEDYALPDKDAKQNAEERLSDFLNQSGSILGKSDRRGVSELQLLYELMTVGVRII